MAKVKIPASTSNLGPGLDCLGLALGLYLVASMEETSNPQEVFDDPGNVFIRAAEIVFNNVGFKSRSLKVEMDNQIPIGAGLGSSGAAIVAGCILANEISGKKLSSQELLEIAISLEGHPDNASPAMFGNLAVSYRKKIGFTSRIYRVPSPVKAVVVLPETTRLATSDSRLALPEEISTETALFNLGRVGSLVAALTLDQTPGDWRDLVEDRLHQKARSTLVPWLYPLIDAAYENGASAAFLSGSGPAVVALCSPEVSTQVEKKMKTRLFEFNNEKTLSWILEIDTQGAQIL